VSLVKWQPPLTGDTACVLAILTSLMLCTLVHRKEPFQANANTVLQRFSAETPRGTFRGMMAPHDRQAFYTRDPKVTPRSSITTSCCYHARSDRQAAA
jgi:hypothetical protein